MNVIAEYEVIGPEMQIKIFYLTEDEKWLDPKAPPGQEIQHLWSYVRLTYGFQIEKVLKVI